MSLTIGVIETPTMSGAAGNQRLAMKLADFRIRAHAVSSAVVVTPFDGAL